MAQVFCQSEAGLVREDLLLHVAYVHVYALQTAPLQTSTPFAFGLICISRPVWQCLRRKGNERLCTNVVSIVVVHLVLFDSDQRIFADCIPGPVARPAARRNSCRSWSRTSASGGGDGEEAICGCRRGLQRCEEGFRGWDEH